MWIFRYDSISLDEVIQQNPAYNAEVQPTYIMGKNIDINCTIIIIIIGSRKDEVYSEIVQKSVTIH